MNLSNVHGAIQLARSGRRTADAGNHKAFERLRVGEQLELNVLKRVDQRTFMVSFGGEQHVMESSMHLAVGARVHAVVTGVGDRLELQYLDPRVSGVSADDRAGVTDDLREPASQSLVSALESRYRVTLGADDHAQIERAVAGAADPSAMALGGLYLAKLGVNVNQPALQAIHEAQRHRGVAEAGAATQIARRDISVLVDQAAGGDDDSTQELAQVIGDAVPEAPAEAMSLAAGSGDLEGGQSDARDPQDLAKLFLNLQDGGSVGYRYGTLPVIVSGQLVELDLVVLQQRQQSDASTPVRRLVMSLRTESFGQVRIDARALDNRLVVTFTGESPRSADELASYGAELRTLLKRLGWNVEGVGYELDAQPGRAARQIIDHVLASGTVDVVL